MSGRKLSIDEEQRLADLKDKYDLSDPPIVHLWSSEHSANWCGLVSFRDLSTPNEAQATCAACMRARDAGEIK